MPRTPRKSPNPPGRPAKDAEAKEALELVERTGVSIETAAKKTGISPATVYAHKAAKLPQDGGAASSKPDLLELLRRIGRARNAAAWAEIEEGLEVHHRGGEEALAPWLARPIQAVEVDVDELDALGRGLDLAVEIVERSEPGGPQLRALRELTSLGKSVATVKARRPPELKPDAVHEAIRGAMETSVEHLLRHTREAAAKLVRDRSELAAWAGRELGPRAAVELGERLDAVLGARE